jgi:hypothetical protein
MFHHLLNPSLEKGNSNRKTIRVKEKYNSLPTKKHNSNIENMYWMPISIDCQGSRANIQAVLNIVYQNIVLPEKNSGNLPDFPSKCKGSVSYIS